MANEELQINDAELHQFLDKYFLYYQSLSDQWKRVFISRVRLFINSKNFFGANGFVVENRVKAMIAASAVQLTLGLKIWDYDYFMDIIIHPGVFESNTTKLKQKGETNLSGFIQLSWQSFLKGYANVHDNINLGIHEFSHAFRFNSIRGNPQDYFVQHYFFKWLACAYEIFWKVKRDEQSTFRKYGGTNINEFISVCFEHYFENPQQILQNYPLLYYHTAALLNQYTEANKTYLNVRNEMLIKINEHIQPMEPRKIESNFANYNTSSLIIIVAVLIVITGLSSGFLSGPSVILWLLLGVYYLRMEFLHTKLEIAKREFIVTNGFYLFRNRKRHVLPLSHMMYMQISDRENYFELLMRFYNQKDDVFYEEYLECEPFDLTEFKKELLANKIAVNIK